MHELLSFDTTLFLKLNRLLGISPVFDAIVRFCSVYLIYILIVAVFLDVIRRDRLLRRGARLSRDLFSLIITLASAYGITEMIRDTVDRVRPLWELSVPYLFSEITPSFPSGHTSFVFALATFLFLFGEKRAAVAVYILGALVGFSRVIAGVHYPLDVLGGMLAGTLMAWAVQFVLSHASKR